MLYALPEEMEIYSARMSNLLCPASAGQLSLLEGSWGLEETWEREVTAASTGSSHCPICLPTTVLPAGERRGRESSPPTLPLDLIYSPPIAACPLQTVFSYAPSLLYVSGCCRMK